MYGYWGQCFLSETWPVCLSDRRIIFSFRFTGSAVSLFWTQNRCCVKAVSHIYFPLMTLFPLFLFSHFRCCVQFSLTSQKWRPHPQVSPALAELLFRLNVSFSPMVLTIMTSKLTNSMEQSPTWEAIIIQLIKKLPPFMEPEGLLPSQDPAPCSRPYPDEFSYVLTLHFNSILASTLTCPNGLSLQGFQWPRAPWQNICFTLSLSLFRPLSRSTFVWSGRWLSLD
jgi:hypothetical protein